MMESSIYHVIDKQISETRYFKKTDITIGNTERRITINLVHVIRLLYTRI